jgi:membrane protein DedA with SNARE-associated domain
MLTEALLFMIVVLVGGLIAYFIGRWIDAGRRGIKDE